MKETRSDTEQQRDRSESAEDSVPEEPVDKNMERDEEVPSDHSKTLPTSEEVREQEEVAESTDNEAQHDRQSQVLPVALREE